MFEYFEFFCFLLLTLVFGFVLRLPFSLATTSDQWAVFTKIKKHVGKRWLDSSVPDSLTGGMFPTPMFAHYIVSRFPERMWRPVSIVTNLGSDILTALLVTGAILYACSASEISTGISLEMGWLGAALFLTTPAYFPVTSRLRASNGRCFGLFLHTAYLILLYGVVAHGSLLCGVAATSVFIFICVSSFFAMQSALLCSAGLSLWYMTPVPILIPGAALLLAFIFPALYVRDVFIFKINHFLWYWADLEKYDTVSARNLISNFFLFFKTFGQDWFKTLNLFYRTSPLLIALYSIPALWFWLILLATNSAARMPFVGGFGNYCLAITVISMVLFLATSSGRFVIFGQAERYFDYSCPFITVALILSLVVGGFSATSILTLFLIFHITVIFFNEMVFGKRYFRWLGENNEHSEPMEVDISKKIADIEGPVHILTVPIKLSSMLTRYNDEPERIKYYYRFMQHGMKLDALRDFQEDTEDLHVFAGSPETFVHKYGATHVICQRTYLKEKQFGFIDALLKHEIIYENENYILFDAVKKHGG